MPYIAREGTLKVAHAVRLDTSTARLWRSPQSRYRVYPDPALVLPGKYNRESDRIVTNTNNASAMQLRGMRFYVPELFLHSDTSLLECLTYEISVPVYNASFQNANNFDIAMYYINENQYDIYHPEKSMAALRNNRIQTLKKTLYGWGDNKDWVTFTWRIPTGITTGNYILFVQIDPDNALKEVHDSRLDSAGKIVDSGGNNEGYFKVHIASESSAKTQRRINSSSFSASSAPRALTPRGTIYRAVAGRASGAGQVFRSAAGIGSITANATFGETSGLEMNDLLDVFGEGYKDTTGGRQGLAETIQVSEDVSYTVVMDITYDGDEYYPEAYLRGYNYKAGTDEVDHAFLNHRMALVPHSTTTLVFNLNKEEMDYVNGSGFEVIVPSIAAEAVREEIAKSVEITREDTDTSTDTGTETPVTGSLGSSGGGCGSFSLGLFGLAAAAFLSLRKTR